MYTTVERKWYLDDDIIIESINEILDTALEMIFQGQHIKSIQLVSTIESLFFKNIQQPIETFYEMLVDLALIEDYKTISITLKDNEHYVSMAYLPELKLIVVDIDSFDVDESQINSLIKETKDNEIVYVSNYIEFLSGEQDMKLIQEIKSYLAI